MKNILKTIEIYKDNNNSEFICFNVEKGVDHVREYITNELVDKDNIKLTDTVKEYLFNRGYDMLIRFSSKIKHIFIIKLHKSYIKNIYFNSTYDNQIIRISLLDLYDICKLNGVDNIERSIKRYIIRNYDNIDRIEIDEYENDILNIRFIFNKNDIQ